MIQQATLPIAVSILPTDTVSVVGSTLVVVRDHHEVYRINLAPISAPVTRFTFGPTGNIKSVFWEKRMPGINLSLHSVVENQNTGAVTFRWSDGTESPVSNWSELTDVADAIDADNSWLKKLMMAISLRRSPGGENKTTLVGAQASANLIAAEPITFTEAQ